ncbi:serine hydrolase domain-containing protein [Pyxidicoccus caerfyrddinensis]|uniref:serine hydrolase domain-containing protein n=1 Tax=Pyxidicoccus caerfyrddinensis TaxID=2709663 RepID=UPI0019674563|nr:serine hydrolase domain-containing protein [Pyxidicoccus caerfyrddinensis]
MTNVVRVLGLSLGVVMLWACGGGSSDSDAGTPPDAGVSDAGTDGGSTVPDAGTQWDAVGALMEARVADAGLSVPGLGLAVYDAQDRKVYEHMVGDFAPDRRVAVASSSKMVAGAVLFEVIRQGHLTLDSTTGEVLGWTGDKANITLRHLLSFTSGMQNEHLCTLRADYTLADCVAIIATTPQVAPPGTRFDYGSTHLQVAARMAEVKTGKRWNDLFRETLAAPLGLPPEVTYFTAPRKAEGTSNPLIAGGLRTSMNEYAPLLALVFHRGSYAGLERGTPELFDAQTREPFPDVTIGNSPVKDLGRAYRYGLTAWLHCDTPADGCDIISSPGAFGWTPWMDREAGYYAVLGMQLDRSNEGVVGFSVDLSVELQPLIRAALGH